MKSKHLLLMLLMAFFAPWAANAQTSLFSEDFESGSMPAGWTTDGSGSWSVGVGDYSTSTGAGHGSYNAKITHGSTGNVTKLITPEIDLSSVASAELSFMHVQRSWAGDIDYLKVYYRTSSSETWTQLVAYTSAISSWTTEEEIVLPNTSATYQLAFEHTDNYGYGVGLDQVVIMAPSSCPKPTGLTVSNVSAHSATLSWTSDGNAWQIGYSNDNFATEQYVDVTETSYTLTGLAPETAYQVRVQNNCGGGTYSEFTNPVSFTTTVACPAPTGLAAALTPGNGSVATLSWTSDASAWVVAYKTADATDFTEVNVTENPYTLTSLTPETTYNAKVKAVCGGEDGESSWSNTITFTPTDAYTLTVNDGTTTNGYVPIYGYYCDNYSRSQFIIPATGLAAMQWGTISKLTFYAAADKNWGAQFEVYMTEVDYTTFPSTTLVDWTTMDKVMNTASLSISGNQMVVTLDAPYQYMGGNLMIGINQTVSGSYSSCSWYGVTATGASLGGYGASISQQNFLPKTTFDYIPGEAPACMWPTNLAQTHTNHSATLSWTAGNEGQNAWQIAYSTTSFDPNDAEFDLTTVEVIDVEDNPYTFDKTLAANTHYYMYVRGNCGDEDYSKWVGIDFTTGAAAPSPTITTVDEITPFTAVLRWTAAGGDFLESYDIYYSQTSGTPTDESEIQYTGVDADFTSKILENLTEGYWYVYMRAYHGETDGYSSWTPYSGYGFQVPEACPEPTGLTASDPTPNSITLTWTEGAEWQYAWKVAYSTNPEFNPEEMDPDTFVDVFGQQGPTITCTVNGLESETTYYFRVLGNCNSPYGDSDWTDAVSETTLVACPVPTNLAVTAAQTTADLTWTGYSDSYTVQYRTAGGYDSEIFQGFEEGMGEWTTNNCHNNTGVTTSYGDAMFRFYYTTNYPQYLISPLLNGDNGGTMSFQYARYSTSYEEYFKVGYSTTTNDPEDFTWDEEVTVTNLYTTEFLEYTYTIPAGTKYVSIACTSNDAFYLFIDDITIQCGEYNEPGEWIAIENVEDETITIEGLEFGTKYDAQVKANCGEEYCDYVTFTTNALKRFTTEGNWSDASNWTPAGVPTIEDVVSIEAAATITDIATANEININGGSITIEEGGQLYHNNAVAVTLIKGIEGWNPTLDPDMEENNNGYALIASPVYQYGSSPYLYRSVEGTGLNTGNYDLYEFNQNYEGAEWRNYKNNEFESLYVGEGYLYANEEGIDDITFEGTALPTTEITRSLVYNSGYDFTGWNLMGNPFTCLAYVNRGFYTLNGEGNEVVSATSNSIEVMEGIFVVAERQNETVTFSTTAPGKSANLVLNLNNGRTLVDRAIVSFGESSQLRKVQLNPNHTKVYVPQDGVDYAIVNASEMGEMPVNFKAENNGNFTMNFTSENVSFNYLHLIDNMTGADVDLLATPSYSFSAQSTDYANRFKLVFATGNNSNEDNFAFFSNGSFVINNDGEATLQVVDVMGRILKSETINGSASVNVNAAPGVYMLRLVNGDNMKVQKVVVR